MIVNAKQATKDLDALNKLNMKIKFKGKESLNELTDILIQAKTFGSNLKKDNPELQTQDFEIDRLISDLKTAMDKERISRKKQKEVFVYTVDILRFHIFASLSAQLSRLQY